MKKGFTLIELVATITVLAIIVAMVVIDANYFDKERSKKDRENIKSIVEENTKTLVETNPEISSKVNQTLQLLESEKETDDTVEVACYIGYKKLVDSKLMSSNTKYPSDNGKKEIDSNSYIKVSLSGSYNYKYEFVYVDEEEATVPSLTNCLN